MPTPTDDAIATLRARKAALEAELATVTRMLDAADGKTAAPVVPVLPLPQPSPVVPFWLGLPAYLDGLHVGGTLAIDTMPPRLDAIWTGTIGGPPGSAIDHHGPRYAVS
jgi:hypothetical protein